MGTFSAMSSLAAVVAPYVAIVAIPTGIAAGAVYGAVDRPALSETDVAFMEGQVKRNLASLQIPSSLASHIAATAGQDTGRQLPLIEGVGPEHAEAARMYRQLALQGADSVLEVVVPELGFTGGKALRFYMVADIRVIRTVGDQLVYERRFVYQSDAYDAPFWVRNNAALLQRELQRAHESIAGSVVEQLFLLTELPLATRSTQPGNTGWKALTVSREACGLAWVSPERDYRPRLGVSSRRESDRFPVVDSERPMLAWEAFPRHVDVRSEALSGVSNVRYDLRIWEAYADGPPRLIYERRDLPGTTHVLEESLPGGRRYYWSVRARFDLAGEVHGTKWGCFRYPLYIADGKVYPDASPVILMAFFKEMPLTRDVCTMDFIPTANYYRFQIP